MINIYKSNSDKFKMSIFFSDKNSCLPPTIPNGNHTNHDAWYKEGAKIWIDCEEGYEHKERDTTAVCRNGTWSSVPVCEGKSVRCVPHDSSDQNNIRV